MQQDLLQKFLADVTDLDSEAAGKLRGYFSCRNLRAGEVLFKEGDPADHAALVVKGALEVKKETEFPGKYFVLSILAPGGVVGEMALAGKSRRPRSASVTALRDSDLAVIGQEAFHSLMEKHPEIAAKLLRFALGDACLRLQGANRRMAAVF